MDEDSFRGPQVKAEEDLYRAITPEWWVVAERRPSSAAFNHGKFSVNVVSLTTPEVTLSQFPQGPGLVSFNCGMARALDFDARHEMDRRHPENKAHANVYCDCPTKERKRRSRQFVTLCKIIQEPIVSGRSEL